MLDESKYQWTESVHNSNSFFSVWLQLLYWTWKYHWRHFRERNVLFPEKNLVSRRIRTKSYHKRLKTRSCPIHYAKLLQYKQVSHKMPSFSRTMKKSRPEIRILSKVESLQWISHGSLIGISPTSSTFYRVKFAGWIEGPLPLPPPFHIEAALRGHSRKSKILPEREGKKNTAWWGAEGGKTRKGKSIQPVCKMSSCS